MISNPILKYLILFVLIYLMLFITRDVVFMVIIYIKLGVLYLRDTAFGDAFKATFSLYIPLVVLDIIYTKAKKQKNQKKHIIHMQPEKQKKWKKKKK
ncbi:hypothetical protein [uncultured Actinobacillus sp.]|uniref:hypothetical protein n=1 Tax=uncultured Actinobacillus sp. TaxID=417616 RepID=UPI0025E1E898|nr:hypothetical protein [uncultured Actinobacillus sp.]